MNLLNSILGDIQTIISSIVIKYERQGKNLDTIDIRRDADRYVSAMLLQDSFNTYQSFDAQAFNNIGILNSETIINYNNNKNLIPLNKRDALVKEQRKIIINNYVEKNNYYRMLNGLPDINDFDFIYVPEDIALKYSLDPNTPIHEYTRDELTKLADTTVITDNITKYPTKKYLNFLGTNKIDIITARTARNFGILNMSTTIPESFFNEFTNTYELCREYFLSTMYIPDYSSRYALYDNFIAFSIIIMTIQRVVVNTFKNGIDRDFYDLNTIKMMFEAYNVPFIENLPIEYQRILLRNLNNLLRYKSTDKVLYDICSLLGFERIKIYKYYLMKEHKLDIDEKPLFLFKEVTDEQGVTTLVEDKENMYNFYFQAVELREKNLPLALSESSMSLDYAQIVTQDPYWWDNDEELKKSLYEKEFNFIETKFLNMNIMYKLTEMLFEVIYIFRMLIDKKEQIQHISLSLPKLFDGKRVKLFDTVVMMSALLCKKNKLAGNIIDSPSKALAILGFNFNADFTTIRKFITDNSDLIDPKILNYINKMNIVSPSDINTLFSNIKGFNDFIIDKMAKSQNIDEYRAYQKIFKALTVTQHVQSLFMKSNGEVATTFLDYLQDVDYESYNFVVTCEEDRITEYIDHILFKLNELVADLKYLYIINDSNNVLLNAVITLTRFFKSYTTDLSSFNILYLMDSRYYNMIKLINDIEFIDAHIKTGENKNLLINEKNTYHINVYKDDVISAFTNIIKGISSSALLKDSTSFENLIKYIQKDLNLHSFLMYNYSDVITLLQTEIKNKEVMTIKDKIKLVYS